MTQDPQPMLSDSPKRHTRLWAALGILAVLLVLLIVPPMVSINRYRASITEVVSTSLGRPVRLSSVELRMLPRPGFLITNFTVEGDPAYDAEPVLHAESVFASIRILPLWRGKLQISRIGVDEASLNLVRNPSGHWNLDSILRTAAAQPGAGARRAVSLPYLEATNARINVKNGTEKLPFSILSADLSAWREDDGAWRVRLKGQPARTDLSLDLADTGLIRLEATVRPAPMLKQMPLHVDLEWREAQLGQLSRLLLGSDEGWRGDLRGEMHLDGTADSAQVKSRLRATGVHRAEFAPAEALDFDATCALVYHFSGRSVENLRCESPLGNGRARLTGNLPGPGGSPRLTLELDRIPAQAGLDVLRTVRGNLDRSLEAEGAVSGKLTYDPALATAAQPTSPEKKSARHAPPAAVVGPLAGSLTVDGLRITGDALSKPIQVPKVTIEPAAYRPDQPPALAASFNLPAGAPNPLAVSGRAGAAGFQFAVHGGAALPRLRELAHTIGIEDASALDGMAGDPATLDLDIRGAWLPSVVTAFGSVPAASSEAMTGTVAFQNANWKSAHLSSVLLLKNATLHLEDGGLRWESVDFAYGPVKGTAELDLPAGCAVLQDCSPRLTLQFAALDAAMLQSALLGAHEPDTLLSTLLARVESNSSPAWPNIQGTLRADSLALGPFSLSDVSGSFHILPSGAELTSLNADVLGGAVHATATMSADSKPSYKVDAAFTGLSPALAGKLVDMRWAGGALDGSLQLELAGYTDHDLISSAHGKLHFDWPHGTMTPAPGLPPSLARFDDWTGEAAILNGGMVLRQNQIQRASRKAEIQAAVTFEADAKLSFGARSNSAISAKK